MQPETDRRSFLSWAIFGLGAIFSTIIGVPIVCYVIDPRNRKGPPSSFRLVEGIKLDKLLPNEPPQQGVIRDVRLDGWTLYPNDVLGRVWVVPVGPRPADLTSREAVEAFNQDEAKKAAYLAVFTTICPHLGCFVNFSTDANGFACPCHAATFRRDGNRATDENPAKRGMDTLEWEIDASDPDFNRINVKYKRFKTLEEKKLPLGGETTEANA
jgi:Rieske Fe-S protein